MKKIILIMLLVAAISTGSVMATSLRSHQVEFVDEFGDPVPTITSITVFDSGLGSSPTIFSDRAGNLTMTNPITTGSDNSTFLQATGLVTWFQQKPTYKLTVTDGSKTLTIDSRDEGDTRFPWYDNYIGTAASLSVGDNEEISVGDSSDMVLAWNNSGDFMSWIPNADGSAFNLGTSGTGKNVDFNWFVDTDLGIKGDEGAATLIIDGVTISLNTDSNFATNINTGTSTQNVSIGSSTSGTVAIDTTAGITINADDSIDMTTSGNTADIDIDAADGSVIIDGGEDDAAAVTIAATHSGGGVIVSSGTGDITLDSGDDIFLAADTGSGDVISIINTQGTAAAAVILRAVAAGGDVNIESKAGRVLIEGEEDTAETVLITADGGASSTVKVHADTGTTDESIYLLSDLGGLTLKATAGSIDIEAGDSGAGDIGINAADDMTLTVAGDFVLAVTGSTTLPNDVLLKTTTAITDTQMDNLAGTQIELVAGVAGNTIEFVSAIFALDWNSTAWIEPSAPDDLVIRYVDGSGAIVSHLLDATGFATATEDTVAFVGSNVSDAAGADVASVAVTEAASTNKALVLDNTGDEWTNSGNSQVVVIVYYRLHTTAELGLD